MAKKSRASNDIDKITAMVRAFVRARDWEQFHTPKNLVMALAGEVGELTELFQWLTPEESANTMSRPEQAERVRDELADVVVYALRIADVLGVDVGEAIHAKFKKNAAKYPVKLARGNARKYTELGLAARPGKKAPKRRRAVSKSKTS